MRILMINSFFYLRGGAERCFLDLMALLAAHGHEVIPFCMTDERNRPTPYASHFISHINFPERLRQGGSWRDKWTVLERVVYSREARDRLAALIAETKPDIAHVHGIAHEMSPSVLPVLRRAGIPVVQTLHDYKLLCPNTSFVSNGRICEACKGHRYYNAVRYRCKRGSLAASLLAALEATIHKAWRIYERNVDVFITPSQFLQHKLKEYGISNPVVHIPNFIDVDRFRPCDEPEDYILFSGRLVGIKGIKTLLTAMCEVRQARLLVAGDGELRTWAEAFIRKHDLTHVELLGHLKTAELVDLIRRARFTVVPSEWYENYPMSVLESLACGTPVIGSRIGGIPELVHEGQTGLLFRPGDTAELVTKIRFLWARPELARGMGQNGRLQVTRVNNPERHYQQTMSLYQELLAQKRAAHATETAVFSAGE